MDYLEAPNIKGVRFCKAIIPSNENARKSCCPHGGRMINSGEFSGTPRIVKTNFKTPPNWHEVASYEDGQPFDENNHRVTTLDFQGQTLMLVHTCSLPYDECFRGFWGRWIKSDVQDKFLEENYQRQNRGYLTSSGSKLRLNHT